MAPINDTNENSGSVAHLHKTRPSRRLADRVRRVLEPPNPFVMNPRENIDAPLGRWNLYIGGAGSVVDGYVNVDLFGLTGVDVVADGAVAVRRYYVSTRRMRRRAGTCSVSRSRDAGN